MYIVYSYLFVPIVYTVQEILYILLREQQKLYKINIYYKRILYKTCLH